MNANEPYRSLEWADGRRAETVALEWDEPHWAGETFRIGHPVSGEMVRFVRRIAPRIWEIERYTRDE